jgi:hypothetical protein
VTLEELDATLPSGFHDSYVSTLTIDYVQRKATLDIQVWIGSMAAPRGLDREKWRPGRLELSGLLFCAIDPPDSTYDYAKPAPLWIDVSPWEALQTARQDSLVRGLPAGAFASRIFVQQWNAFIRVAAMKASLTWLTLDSSSQ